MLDADAVRREARGQWEHILTSLGVDEKFLKNRHGPCPACGGTDRFRFDDKDGEGSYYCSGCGAGHGLHLLMNVNGWKLPKACEEVARLIGFDAPERRQEKPAGNDIRTVWRQCRPDAPEVLEYLRGRGLDLASVPPSLRFHSAMPYWVVDDDKPRLLGKFPCMVAPVLDNRGQLKALHRTYLADDLPSKKKLTKSPTKLSGVAVRVRRLGEATHMLVTEGIENALAVEQFLRERGKPVDPIWALVSTSFMQSWSPPPQVARVVICGDNDVNFAGHAAAYTLAHKLAMKGVDCEVKMPPTVGLDWLDTLNAWQRKAA